LSVSDNRGLPFGGPIILRVLVGGCMELLTLFERELSKRRVANNSPYGDVVYADPGFQQDKKKRYPVDTPEHARSAAMFIMQGDNAKAYSLTQLAHIKMAIRTACKKFGIDTTI